MGRGRRILLAALVAMLLALPAEMALAEKPRPFNWTRVKAITGACTAGAFAGGWLGCGPGCGAVSALVVGPTVFVGTTAYTYYEYVRQFGPPMEWPYSQY